MSDAFNALYHRLIRLYPASFRSEFGEEMQDVFSQALFSRKSNRQKAAFLLKEVFDLPGALLRQHLAAWIHVQGVPMVDAHGSPIPSSRQEAGRTSDLSCGEFHAT